MTIVSLARRMSLAALAAGAMLGQADATPLPLQVFDANGTLVGRLDGPYYVWATVGGNLTALALGAYAENSTLAGFVSNSVYFRTTNCSGTPYMAPAMPAALGVRNGSIVKTGGQTWVYIASAYQAKPYDLHSRLGSDGCSAITGTVNVIPTLAPIDVSGTWVEPFKVR